MNCLVAMPISLLSTYIHTRGTDNARPTSKTTTNRTLREKDVEAEDEGKKAPKRINFVDVFLSLFHKNIILSKYDEENSRKTF